MPSAILRHWALPPDGSLAPATSIGLTESCTATGRFPPIIFCSYSACEPELEGQDSAPFTVTTSVGYAFKAHLGRSRLWRWRIDAGRGKGGRNTKPARRYREGVL